MDQSEKVADEFSKIYSHEWKEARAALSREKHEEEIIYLLMRIVRGIHDMCSQRQADHRHKHPSADNLTKEYIHHQLPKSLHKDQVTGPVRSFIYSCIKCIFSLCSMTEPLEIFWIPKGEVIDTEMFSVEAGKSGQICDWTVWPAVIKEDGRVVRKGVVIPI